MKNYEFSALKPTISKEYLFSKGINQESIMAHYTGQDITSKKLVKSCLRTDNHVTVSYYKSKSGILYMHDFATNEHINCFEVVMRLYNCNYYRALEIIAEDFGLIDNKETRPIFVPEVKETIPTKIEVKIKDFSEQELDWWKSYGITKEILKKYNVYSLQHVFLNGELKFTSTPNCPIFGYYFGINKRELWKIYFPANKDKGIRFINNLSAKKLQGYKQLPKSGELLIITKSLKDCACLYSYGLNAVAPSSESTFCTDNQLEEFKNRFRYILVMYDQDKAGKYNMAKIRHKHPELNYFVLPKYLKCKDFSDLRKMYGDEHTKEMIIKFLINYKFK